MRFDSHFDRGRYDHSQGEPLEANPYDAEKYRRGTWAFDVSLARSEWANGWKHEDRLNPLQRELF